MHILLTDRLTCPRCGPDFGLILLAEHIQDRRVLKGEIGCANCRERFLIRDGYGDLRWPSEPDPIGETEPEGGPGSTGEPGFPGEDTEAAVRVAALLGITAGPGLVLLLGSSCDHATKLADLVSDIEWIAADGSARRTPEREGVSRIGASPKRLPFFNGVFRGAVVEGTNGAELPEIIRVLTSAARVVLVKPPDSARASLEEAGFDVVLDDGTTLVAAAKRAGAGVASSPPRN